MERLSRWAWLGFVGLCLLAGLGYVQYDSYLMDGDSVSFMDIGDGLSHHHASLALNSYWNPLYPAFLALAQTLTHTSRWHELHVYACLNWLIFVACIGATVYLVDGLVRLQQIFNPNGLEDAAMSPLALRYAAIGILFCSFERELRIGFIRSDSLLLLLLLLAAGLVLRLEVRATLLRYAALGLTLGLAYLTKSFAFLPSAFLLLGMLIFGATRKGLPRRSITLGAILAGSVFVLIAGPYIAGISRQMGHFTTGESARLNYAHFVDGAERWHEWTHGTLGHATGPFLHPELMLLGSPPVFSFRNHPVGTLPLWLDPAWFTAGLKAHVWLPGHLRRLLRNSQLLPLWIANHPEGPLLLGVLLASGAVLRRRRQEWWPWLVVPAWGLLMLAIYFPIDLQERYLTTMLMLILVPVLAMLRRPASDTSDSIVRVGNGAAVLLALFALTSGFQNLLDMRRQIHLVGRTSGLYSDEIFGAAKGLVSLGVKPGDALGCMGGQACYRDPYWARLTGAQIMGEVEVLDSVPTDVAWNSFPNKQAILDALRSQGIHVIVTTMPGVSVIPPGWRQLETSSYFAYTIPDAP